ncbi:proteinase inhibitor I4 serpin [Scytonema hofmannii PCC 7110]|uniref:Proteinase inhibitor I4 serpin n=1 Tax=Scytonema hofmannii PCC 7110 TaxID=128403 RepID=A0A139WUG1_9CYAN|nr:serpin family protein [Scytonema hofmannii]KYC36061.1 proteinase inhibitor I4 serpin [Scytonema hofmannii PCC 7110]
MKRKSNARENFLQRRYGVRLGRRYVLTAASVVLMGVIGCSQIGNNTSAYAQTNLLRSESPMSKQSSTPDDKLVNANTKFGFKLFSEVLNQESDRNIFVSPSSVSIALAMTYNGASGSTREAMTKALELQGLTLQQINSSNAALKKSLENSDPFVKLTIANSLWVNREASLDREFIRRNQDFYTARIANLNFKDANAPSIINSWVNDSTEGKINKIVERIETDQVLFLINAIYFKGRWSDEFDKDQTSDRPFYLVSGQQKQHPMMSQRGDYRYYENQQFQAISLPYGKDGNVSFYIFLPKETSSLKSFYQNLSAENWDNWMSQFSKREGFVRLPRFKMDYDITLNKALTALGMGEAFSNKANFSAMGKNLKISEVKHKTFLEVNEEGTEAAAATSVGIVPLSAKVPSEEPFSMIVNRPFFCTIRDNRTGSILFMGSIVEPLS